MLAKSFGKEEALFDMVMRRRKTRGGVEWERERMVYKLGWLVLLLCAGGEGTGVALPTNCT
jgi:hypothetical protein